MSVIDKKECDLNFSHCTWGTTVELWRGQMVGSSPVP
jgi:hypothetical protein